MAIDGDGFFEIEKSGQRYLTRAGNFQLNSIGVLQTSDGFNVLAAGGGQIQIPTGAELAVMPDGSVLDRRGDGTVLASLSLVRPQQPGDLVRVGQNMFSSLAELMPLAPGATSVRSGCLEKSSVEPTTEMMEMIETSLAFEANVRLIQNQDHMIESLVNRVLGTN